MPNINWGEFINLSYWLEGLAGTRGVDNPTSLVIQTDSWFFWAYLWIFAFFVIMAILLKLSQSFLNDIHPFQRKISIWSTNLALMGVMGFVWFFFRQINANMLNFRLWLLVGIVWLIIFSGLVIRYFWKFYPLEIASYKKKISQK